MDISSSEEAGSSDQAATESVSSAVKGSLPVTLDGGKAVGASFQNPPAEAVELAQQSFTVQVLGPEGHGTSLVEGAKLFVQVGEDAIDHHAAVRAELEAARQAAVGLYTCKHSMALLPGSYRLSVATDGVDVAVVPEQQHLAVIIQADAFVTEIALGSIQPDEVSAGQKVKVPVQLRTHNGEPVRATDAELSNMCKVKLGSKAFSLCCSSPLMFEGYAPDRPGSTMGRGS